ncbi:lycopene beta-cyclase [Sphingobium fontiphilum]|uniref:Lycopene beta-cyclase n=1 Tax=Sphingobium fontiphilum TaxID=944425 RepID=A0A7W6DHM0_9SPHN|nr:lycopene beta-cyclase CrtY [Sphingobium fontiphilum]MBB3982912.1 lycopene beta-cyclase [Sphingobium fontiphilum]
MTSMTCDIAIVGGGLAGGLIALALATRHPDARLLLVEGAPTLGGNHVWSFFDADIAPDHRWLVDPLVSARWPGGHDVRFPDLRRHLSAPYNSIVSSEYDGRLRTILGDRILASATAERVTAGSVMLADGRIIDAAAVIDARGAGDLSALRCGWQKFVGQVIELDRPHGVDHPVIMDATVEQVDGYRFVYLLPMGERRIFVEDTYYSDAPTLEVSAIERRIADYAAHAGWAGARVIHGETGVLPVVYGGDFDRFWPAADPVARAGARAGLFQPMTGYSLPDAVRFACALADRWPMDGPALARFSRQWAADHWRRGGYYRLLGKMLFGAAKPDMRWRIFDRFYRLPEPLIGRFYAGRSTQADRLRILCGKPPVPIRAAMRALLGYSA